MIREGTRLLCLSAALWTALALYRGERPVRLAAALATGAVLTHLGWVVLHWPIVRPHPQAIVDALSGHSVLFLPFAFLFLARDAAAWRALPAALAVARLGCLAAGCCGGTQAPWGTHPTVLYEMIGLIGLHFGLRRLPDRWVAPAFLVGLGLVRIATEPLRAVPPLGPPIVPPQDLAALWIVCGLIWTVWVLGSLVTRCRLEVLG